MCFRFVFVPKSVTLNDLERRLFGQNKLITRFDVCRCIDGYVHRLGLAQIFIVEIRKSVQWA